MDYRTFIEAYDRVSKIVVIDEGLTKLLQKENDAVFCLTR